MFCFSYSLSFSWFFFHILENLHPFLKPVFCRSPKTCFLSGSWGHQKISLTVHPKASPTPPWGPGSQLSSAWGNQSLPQGCHRGILSHSLLFLNCCLALSTDFGPDLSPCHCQVAELSTGCVTISTSACPALVLRDGIPLLQSLVSHVACAGDTAGPQIPFVCRASLLLLLLNMHSSPSCPHCLFPTKATH